MHRITSKNIGQKTGSRLAQHGIFTLSDLSEIGSARAYHLMQKTYPERLPYCFYLFSLEAALLDIDWRALSTYIKNHLIHQVHSYR